MGHPTPCFLWDRHLGSAAPRRLGKLQFTLVEIGLFFPSKWVINHQKKIAKGFGWGVVPLLCPYTEDKAISHEAISLLPRSYVQAVVSPGDLKALCER